MGAEQASEVSELLHTVYNLCSVKMQTYPVKNKLPILALEKSKLDDGRFRFTISKATAFKMDRMSSRLGVEILCQSVCSASTISSHSARAAFGSFGNRWLKNALIAAFSLWSLSGSFGMSRTNRPGKCQLCSTLYRVKKTYCVHLQYLDSPSILCSMVSVCRFKYLVRQKRESAQTSCRHCR